MPETRGGRCCSRIADDFVKAPRHAVTVFGMAGVGKTRLAPLLQRERLVPLLGRLPHRHALHGRVHRRQLQARGDEGAVPARPAALGLDLDLTPTSPSTTSSRSRPISARPATRKRGGLTLAEYQRRQDQHRVAEIAALHGCAATSSSGRHELYGYDDFIADTGGSLIEVVDPDNADDPVVKTLTEHTAAALHPRHRGRTPTSSSGASRTRPSRCTTSRTSSPRNGPSTRSSTGRQSDDDVDPDGFGAWGFEALLHDRLPRYQALADKFRLHRRSARPRDRARRRRLHRS